MPTAIDPSNEGVEKVDVDITQNQPEVTETTLGEVFENETEDSSNRTTPDSNKQDTVPMSTFLDMKNELKELKSQIKENKTAPKDYAKGINDIIEKYDVDANFAQDFLELAKKEVRSEFAPEIDKIKNAENKKQLDSRLSEMLTESLERNPEFKDYANKDVIKSLAQLPQNRNKTMTQILEDTYGRFAERGGKSLERSSYNQKNSDDIDYNNLSEEEERDVLNDPQTAKKYAENQMKHMKNIL